MKIACWIVESCNIIFKTNEYTEMSKVVRKGFRRQLKLVIQHVVENVLAHGKQLNQLEETQLVGVPNMRAL